MLAADMHENTRAAYGLDPVLRASFIAESPNDILVRYAAQLCHSGVDAEGYESDILAVFPFEHWTIRLVAAKHTCTQACEQICMPMEFKGYVRAERSHNHLYELAPGAGSAST